MDEYYLRTVDRRWRKEITAAQALVRVFSPYVTSQTAEGVICCCAASHCELYTKFSINDFASGASSLQTLRRLKDQGVALFELDRLHAKIVIISGRFVSIGSQNLTRSGIRNREANVTISDPSNVKIIEDLIKEWVNERRPISDEMLEEAEALLPPLAKRYRALQREAIKLEQQIRDHQAAREAEILRLQEAELTAAQFRRENEEKREAEILRHRQAEAVAAKIRLTKIARVRSLSKPLTERTNISEDLAIKFLRASTWWLTHSSGRPVRAPGHARYMRGENGDWKIDFGANTFLVGRAIQRCFSTILQFLDDAQTGKTWTIDGLREKLYLNIRGAVATYNGYEYSGYYPVTNCDMVFGATSIDVKDFANVVLSMTKIEELFFG